MIIMLNAVRTAYGLARLIRPGALADEQKVGGRESRGRIVVRALGARQVVQAAASQPAPTAPVLALGAGVDLLHAATMLAVAVAAPGKRRRRAALIETAAALGFAVAGASAAWRTRRGRTPEQLPE